MIRKVKAKRRKNPSFYKYGYHITENKNLDSIIDKGFVRGMYTRWYSDPSFEIADIIYKGKIPNYFITTQSLKYLTPIFKDVFFHSKYNTSMIKVNIEKFNQLPDLDYLLIDYKYKYKYITLENGQKAIDFTKDSTRTQEFSKRGRLMKRLGYDDYQTISPKLRYWVEYYNGIIPIIEFKTNPELTVDTIASTHTLCIAEDISSRYIEDMFDLRKSYEEVWNK